MASLVAFRVLFGLLMAGAAARFLAHGWVTELLAPGMFHFTYPGFSWVRPWPAPWMHVHLAVLAALGLAVAAGAFYRAAIVLFFGGFTYVELIDQAVYLNHYYLVSLLAGMMMLLPLGRAASLDVRRPPRARITCVPAWMLWALRAQIGIVYIYAGAAKLNADWLLRAQPLRIWLRACGDLPLLGAALESPAVAYLCAWSGAAFDLSIVPLLLARRTRRAAFVAVVGFHVATACLFPVGVFPWLMIAAATLFLAPDWPRRLLDGIGFGRSDTAGGAVARPPRALAVLLAAHLLVQVLLPLRQHLAAEPSAWSYRGFNFAWNVMVAEKTGDVVFTVEDPETGNTTRIGPGALLTPTQTAMMAQDPDLIRAFGRSLAARYADAGHPGVRVRADAIAALNGHPARRLMDPDEDIAGNAFVTRLPPNLRRDITPRRARTR